MRISDWSSDVCSSDLIERRATAGSLAPKSLSFSTSYCLSANASSIVTTPFEDDATACRGVGTSFAPSRGLILRACKTTDHGPEALAAVARPANVSMVHPWCARAKLRAQAYSDWRSRCAHRIYPRARDAWMGDVSRIPVYPLRREHQIGRAH